MPLLPLLSYSFRTKLWFFSAKVCCWLLKLLLRLFTALKIVSIVWGASKTPSTQLLTQCLLSGSLKQKCIDVVSSLVSVTGQFRILFHGHFQAAFSSIKRSIFRAVPKNGQGKIGRIGGIAAAAIAVHEKLIQPVVEGDKGPRVRSRSNKGRLACIRKGSSQGLGPESADSALQDRSTFRP